MPHAYSFDEPEIDGMMEEDLDDDVWGSLDGAGHSRAGSTPMKMPNMGEPVQRRSVFDRMSDNQVDERLQFKVGEKSQLLFSTVVGKKVPSSLRVFPLEDKAKTQIKLPVSMGTETAKAYQTTLIGYFLSLIMLVVVSKSLKLAL